MTHRLFGAVLLILAAGVLVAPPAFAVIWGAQHRPEHEDVRAEMARARAVIEFVIWEHRHTAKPLHQSKETLR